MSLNKRISVQHVNLSLQGYKVMTLLSWWATLTAFMSHSYSKKLTSSTHLCQHHHSWMMSCQPANTTFIDSTLTSAPPKHIFCNAHPTRFQRKPRLFNPFSMRVNHDGDAIVSHVVLFLTLRPNLNSAHRNLRPQRCFLNPKATIMRQQPCIE